MIHRIPSYPDARMRKATRQRLRADRSAVAGQAAIEAILVLALIVLVIVLLPDNAIERLMLAIEGRHQAILRHAEMP